LILTSVWVRVASASALNGVPVEAFRTRLIVVAHARAGSDIPEVVVGTFLFQADALLGEFIINIIVCAVKRQFSANTGFLVLCDWGGVFVQESTAVKVLVLSAEWVSSISVARFGLVSWSG